jgi:hypothetical protein
VLRERYFFACEAASVNKALLRNVVELLRGDEMRAVINALPGYGGQIAGSVIELEQAFGLP